MNTAIDMISPKGIFGATFLLPSLGEFSMHTTDTRLQHTDHAMGDMSIGIGSAPKIKDTVIQTCNAIISLSRKENKMDWVHGSIELPHAHLVTTKQWSDEIWGYGGKPASISITRDEYPAMQESLNDLLKNLLTEFFSSYLSTEPVSFEDAVVGLKHRGFSESAESINELLSTDDLEPSDKPLSLESAQGFIKLMDIFQDLGEPMLGRFSEGTLSVEWRLADDKHLLVEPLNSDDASFALIGPSPTRGADRFRLNGRGEIADVVNTLRKNGVDKWPYL